MLVIALAATTVFATFAGGMLALRAKDRFHLVLGLSAGLLLGLVGFDLLPEIFEMNQNNLIGVRAVSIALIIGFLSLHFIEQLLVPMNQQNQITDMITPMQLRLPALSAQLQWLGIYF